MVTQFLTRVWLKSDQNRSLISFFGENNKGWTIIFLSGELPSLGLADNFFKSNAFQTIFFITFCNENNFFTTIFLKCYRLSIDLI